MAFDIQASRNRLAQQQQAASQNHANYRQGKEIQTDTQNKTNQATNATAAATNKTTAAAETNKAATTTETKTETANATNATAGVKIDIQAMRDRLAKRQQVANQNHQNYMQGREIENNTQNTATTNNTETANTAAENTAAGETTAATTTAAEATTETTEAATGGKFDIEASRNRLAQQQQTASQNREDYAQGREIKNGTEAAATNNTEAQDEESNIADQVIEELRNQIENSPAAALNAQGFMNSNTVSQLLNF